MNGREMAQALGVSEATVSRLASGHREPSVTLMLKVRDLLRWKVDAQADALQAGTYGRVFNEKMSKKKTPKGASDAGRDGGGPGLRGDADADRPAA